MREFVAAFKAAILTGCSQPADENIQWLSIDGAKITIETEGKKALRQSMESYFRGCPSCKSALEWVQNAGTRITALERASWTGKTGLKSKKGFSVYEFRVGNFSMSTIFLPMLIISHQFWF